MKYGKFYDKQGIYEFDGRYYKPRWLANGVRNRNWLSIYNICIEGYDAPKPEPANWPKAILVMCNLPSIPLWDELSKSYAGLYAQSQLHYYDATIAAGKVPDWAIPWYQEGYLLMHEYEGGKVVWLREGNFDNDIYMFMVDSDAPVDEPEEEPADTEIVSSGTTIHVVCPHCGKKIF